MSKEISKISSDAVESLMRYSWPGNIRELQNVVERAVILSKGEVLDLPPLPSQEPLQREPVTLAEAERDHILKALEACNWVVGGAFGAAARLGVKRTTLMDQIRRRGCHEKPFNGGRRLCFGFPELCGPSMDQPRCEVRSASRHSCGGKGCPGVVKYQ